jgi:hypothetical protein
MSYLTLCEKVSGVTLQEKMMRHYLLQQNQTTTQSGVSPTSAKIFPNM